METARAWLELRPFDAEEVEGLEVDDVQAAAAIHKYLRESGIDDDGVDDEWVDARGDYFVGLVVLIEGEGVLDQLRYWGTAILAAKTSRRSLLRCLVVSYVEGPP